MPHLLFVILILFSSKHSIAQSNTFSQSVNNLFFGVNIESKSALILDSLLSIPKLHKSEHIVTLRNLNVAIEMKSENAWLSKHQFSFLESPLNGFPIEMGIIEITIGETDSVKKLLSINWQLNFRNKMSAIKCFSKLKQIFSALAAKRKFEKVKVVGEIAQFSANNDVGTGIKEITFCLGKLPRTKKYQISLVFGGEFLEE